jgi:ElaB/YqjD/DUF883 family membrane-anchored ribosome-binding protein
MDLERIAKLETKVEQIQEDVKEVRDDIKELHSRITTQTREIVEKIDDFQTRIEHKMQAGAVASKEQHEKIQNSMRDDLAQMNDRLHGDINKVSDRVDVLERWRWMIVGGAIVLGYLVGHLDIIAKFFGK